MPHTINEFKADIKVFAREGVNYTVVTTKYHVAKHLSESQRTFAVWLENMNG
jgi:hypothetical protein